MSVTAIAGATDAAAARSLPQRPAAPARSGRRHLLDFTDWQVDELVALLDTAEVMAQVLTRTIKKVPALQGFTVASLFFEDSTRTRLSFERAAIAQSADVMTFSAGGSSLKKGESMRDTLRTLDQLQADLYVVRHPAAGAPHQLARWTDAAVVNAGDGRHAHPTQALRFVNNVHMTVMDMQLRKGIAKRDTLRLFIAMIQNVHLTGDSAEA